MEWLSVWGLFGEYKIQGLILGGVNFFYQSLLIIFISPVVSSHSSRIMGTGFHKLSVEFQ